MHYSDKDRNHRLAYQNVIDYNDLWDLTTDRYKGSIMDKYLNYTIEETGSKFIPFYYMHLYYKYINYYKNED